MTADGNSHAPTTGILRGFLYAVRSNAANYGFQIWFGTADGIFTMKVRAWILNVGWENWKQVPMT